MPEAPNAVRELTDDPASRKKFLRWSAPGWRGCARAVHRRVRRRRHELEQQSSTPASQPMVNTSGTAQFGEGDVGIVKYALTLEYLEADFYKQAAESGMLKGEALELGKQFGEHEQEHVDALEATLKKLGGKPPAKPKGKFPLDSQDAILDLAATVENLGAAAYLGQADKIKDPEILAAALSIHSVEARHAAALNRALGMAADARRRLRQAGDGRRGAQGRQALHRVLGGGR